MHEGLICQIKNYIDLEPADQEVIQRLFKVRILSKGEYFLEAGNVCRQVGFIGQGLLRYYYSKDGEEVTYNFGRETDFVCNYISFFQKTPSSKTIQALETTRLLVIQHDDLQVFYGQVKQGEKFGRLLMEHNYVEAIGQLASQYTDSPEQRYLKFLSSFPDLQERLPQYLIASYVGVKPPSLSRIRRRLAGK